MSPSSGARSGTKPSRSDRRGGSGRVGPILLKCGHETHALEPVAIFPDRRKLYSCPNGCGLQEPK